MAFSFKNFSKTNLTAIFFLFLKFARKTGFVFFALSRKIILSRTLRFFILTLKNPLKSFPVNTLLLFAFFDFV